MGRGTMDGVPAQRPRVVIVDDHPAFRRAARALLDARGFTVVGEASESTAAQTLVARLAPDAVLLDVGLGAECGFDVARTLTAAHPRLAVLLVSAREDADAARARVCGACGFLPKSRLAEADLGALWRLRRASSGSGDAEAQL